MTDRRVLAAGVSLALATTLLGAVPSIASDGTLTETDGRVFLVEERLIETNAIGVVRVRTVTLVGETTTSVLAPGSCATVSFVTPGLEAGSRRPRVGRDRRECGVPPRGSRFTLAHEC